MFAMLFLLHFVLLDISSVLSALLFEPPCPKLKVVDDLNITAFVASPWYEIARYPNDWEQQGDCTLLSFEGAFIKNLGIRFSGANVDVNHKLNEFKGYIDYDDKNKPGTLVFKSNVFEGSEGEDIVLVNILHIKYDKYYIGYDCVYEEAKKLRHDYVWITSRTKNIDAETKKEINEKIKTFDFIKGDKLVWEHFDDETCRVVS